MSRTVQNRRGALELPGSCHLEKGASSQVGSASIPVLWALSVGSGSPAWSCEEWGNLGEQERRGFRLAVFQHVSGTLY